MTPSKTTTAAKMGHATASPSALLELPKSIKDKIYHYALIADRPLDFDKKAFLIQYALLNTCTQVRKEATPIFFGENVFVISNIESESTNFLKAADGTLKKLLIDIAITKRVRTKCKNQPSAIAAALRTRAYHLPDFVLMWGPPPERTKLVWPENKNGKFTTDHRIIYVLNMAFQDRFAYQCQPGTTAVRNMTRKKMNEIKAREEAARGMTDSLGFKGADLSYKIAAELNGGQLEKFGGGGGVDMQKFLASLSIDERREMVMNMASM